MDRKRLQDLARQFIINTIKLQPGENIWIEFQGAEARQLADECRALAEGMKAKPYLIDTGGQMMKTLFDMADQSGDREAFLKTEGDKRLEVMRHMQAYIRIHNNKDVKQAALTADQMSDYSAFVMQNVNQHRIRYTRWLVTQAPSKSFAADCKMSESDFADYYYNACMADYSKMREAVKPLQQIMQNGKHVHITGLDTDISFSIDGIPAMACAGEINVPDGECFSAPVRESANGFITFGRSNYLGFDFPWIRLEVEQGRIVKALSDTEETTARLNTILDKDEGARYFGEFAIAFNPQIWEPCGSILFDEKIAGSFHLTPGACYQDMAPNGNNSAVHWDMVKIQRPEYGGGDIIIDDQLIRRDGLFVPEELQPLNPENLK